MNTRHRRHAAWRDTHWRSLIVQVLVLVALAALAWWLIGNVASALSRRHVASGFGFLEHTAGFGIAQTLIDYTEESSYGQAMWVGLANTLLVSVIAIVLSTVIGFIVGIGRLSTNWLVAKLCTAYVELLRNMPLLLQILFWYFGVLATLPGPRESITVGAAIAINNRGLFLPLLLTAPDHGSCGAPPFSVSRPLMPSIAGRRCASCAPAIAPRHGGRSCSC